VPEVSYAIGEASVSEFDEKAKEEIPTGCADCGSPIDERHARFFSIHEEKGRLRCARCYHRRKRGLSPLETGGKTIAVPEWVLDEIVCLLGLADGLSDLARRTSKEIGCECQKEIKDEQGRVIDVIDLCIYHEAQDVLHRAMDVIQWLEEAGVPRRGA
jgi:hypothetical protein